MISGTPQATPSEVATPTRPLSARLKAAIAAPRGDDNPGSSPHRNSFRSGVSMAIATMANRSSTGVVRDLFLYLIFLCLFIIVTLTRSTTTIPNAWKTSLEERFSSLDRLLDDKGFPQISFDKINSRISLWMYLTRTLPSTLVADGDFEGNTGMIGRNHLVGPIRARQARSTTESCNLKGNERLLVHTETCITSELSQAPFGGPDGRRWTWSPDPQHLINRWLLAPDAKYGLGGYDSFLSVHPNETQATIKSWQLNNFIDLNTRALMIDFTLYNAVDDLFCMVRLLFELPTWGGAKATGNFRVSSLSFYDTVGKRVSAAFELLFVVSFARMGWVLVGQARRDGYRSWASSAWNILEAVNMLVFSAIIVITVVIRICGQLLFDRLLVDDFINWQNYAYSSNQLRNLTAVNAVLTWIRILKYMRLSARMSILERAFITAKVELTAWLILFVVVYASFVQAFYIGFHQTLSNYRTLAKSSMTLFHGMFGDLNFVELQDENRVLGPVLCVFYVCAMIFILVNMLLLILEDAWMKTIEEIKDEQFDGLAAAMLVALDCAKSTASRHMSRMVRRKSKRGTAAFHIIPERMSQGAAAVTTAAAFPSSGSALPIDDTAAKKEFDDLKDETESGSEESSDNDSSIDEDEDGDGSEAGAMDNEFEDQLIQTAMTPRVITTARRPF